MTGKNNCGNLLMYLSIMSIDNYDHNCPVKRLQAYHMNQISNSDLLFKQRCNVDPWIISQNTCYETIKKWAFLSLGSHDYSHSLKIRLPWFKHRVKLNLNSIWCKSNLDCWITSQTSYLETIINMVRF